MNPKYTLCIKLKIDGKEVEQELATLSLEALQKYTSYCKDFNELIIILSKTHRQIATFLDQNKSSNNPLFIKKDNITTDLPVLYNDDIDILLITKEELASALDWDITLNNNYEELFNDFESRQKLMLYAKKERKIRSFVDLNKEIYRTKKEDDGFFIITLKDERLKELNRKLDKKNENYGKVLDQISLNIQPLLKENNKPIEDQVRPNLVIETTPITDEDILRGYQDQLKFVTDPKEEIGLKERIRLLNDIIELEKDVNDYDGKIKTEGNEELIKEFKERRNELNLRIMELRNVINGLDDGELIVSDAGFLVKKDDNIKM